MNAENKKQLLAELQLCSQLWHEKGHCTFGGKTHCKQCAVPYLLLKLLTGEVLHGPACPRLSCAEWQKKITDLEKEII